LSQTQISVLFENTLPGVFNLTGPSPASDWIVKINGTTIPVTTVLVGVNRVLLTFDASGLAGHSASEPFVKPGETLTVAFTNASGSLKTAGNNALPTAGDVVSKNNYPLDCNELGFVAQGAFAAQGICAPVSVNATQWIYAMSLRLRNSSRFVPGPNDPSGNPPGTLGVFGASILYGDPANTDRVYYPYRSDNVGNPSSTFVSTTASVLAGVGPTIFYTYRPNDFTYPDNSGRCSFVATFRPAFFGVTFCNIGTLPQNTLFNSYDNDNENTGTVSIQPSVTGTNRVCLGSNVGMTYSDNTFLNCQGPPVPATAAASPNTLKRWVRIVYGSQNYTTPGNIPDIRVIKPAAMTDPSTPALLNITNNDATGTLINPAGQFFTGPGGLGQPDANGVIELPASGSTVTQSTLTQYIGQILTTQTNNQQVGQRLYVRIEYWNTCNPYNGVSTANAVNAFDYIEIIAKPPALVPTNTTVCFNSSLTGLNFNVTGTTGATTAVRWYNRDPRLGGTLMTNSNGGNSANFPVTSYTTANGALGAPMTTVRTGGVGSVYSVWVTQVYGATNSCESDPVEVTFTVRPSLTNPARVSVPLGAAQVCNGDLNVPYNQTNPAGSTSIALNNFTNSAPVSFPVEYFWSTSNGNVTVDAPTTSQNVTVDFTLPTQPATSQNVTITTLARYTAAPQCPAGAQNATVAVFGVSNGGTISPSATICDGSSTGNMGVTGHRGTVVTWERSFNGGGFVAIIGTSGMTTYSEIPPNGPGVYKYRVLVQNGPCASATTVTANQNTITVNPVPTKPTITASGATTFCQGGSVTLTSTGVDAVSYQWFRNGLAVTGATSSTYVINSVAQTGDYTVQTRGAAPSNCVSPLSDPTTVTVNPLPSASDPTGGGAVCSGNPASDITWTLTGTPPFNFTITRSVQGPLVVSNHNSTTFTITAPNPPSTQNYQLTALTDANGCAATTTGSSITVTVSGVPAPVVQSFTAGAPVCDDGAATTAPTAILDLSPDAVATYNITYTINGNTYTAIGQPSDINGIITFNPPYAAWGNVPGSYPITVTSLVNISTGCTATVPFASPALVVGPRPAAPTGPVANISCSSSATGSLISVNPPAVGFTIVWSSTSPSFAAAAGVTSGTRGSSFTPTSSATATYYAFTRNDNAPNCLSSTGLAVQHTQDIAPTTSNAGTSQSNCSGTFTLAGNLPAGAGEIGTWTVPGILYQQSFSAYTNESTSSALNGWSRDVSGAGVFAGSTGSFRVNTGQFEANNIDGTGTGGAEAVWLSPVLNGPFTNVNISLQLSSTATHEAGDYLRVFYKLNGGAEVALTNGNQSGNISGTVTASATGLSGTTLQLVVRANNSAADEFYRFDNISIAAATAPTITDLNVRNAVVSGLPVGSSTLTWTITSLYGVCPPSASTVTLTRQPLPSVANLTPVICEEVAGGASASNVNLTTYDASVMGGTPASTTVEYYSLATRLPGNQITAPTTIVNGQIIYTRVRNSVTGCTSDGTVTFTVRPLPSVVNQTFQVCEDAPPGSNQRTGINLTTFESAITGGASNRDVEWYTDPALLPGNLIPPGALAGAEQNYSISSDVTLYAKVIDTTPSTPNCSNRATINLDYQPRPFDNQITDGIGQVVGASYTICASNSLVLLQINPGTNPGSTYSWNVPAPAFVGQYELLTSTNNFFIILRFPNPIASPGIPVTVTETLGTAGCAGNTLTTNIIVEGAPPTPIITGPTSVCSNASGIVYSISNPVAGNYSWSLPPGATITSAGVTAPTITVQMSTFSGNVGATHSSSTGCTSPAAAPLPVTIVNRPQVTSASANTICSGENVSAIHTLSGSIVGTTFNWTVQSISGFVSGTAVGNTASGVTSINQTIINTSGQVATVIYNITPVGPAPTSCEGPTVPLTITVNPQPVLVANQAKTICSRDNTAYEILLSPSRLPANTLFNWPDPDGAGPAAGGSNVALGALGTLHISNVLTNTTNTAQTVTYVVTPSAGTCVGTPENIVFTVNPEPVGAIDSGFPPICSNSAVNYSLSNNIATLGNNLVTGTTYSWVAAANANVEGESTTPQTGATISDVLRNRTTSQQTVVYTVTPTNGSCVGNSFQVSIRVNPEPVGTNSSLAICSDVATAIVLSTNASAAPAATYDIVTSANGLTQSSGTVSAGTGKLANELADDVWTNTTTAPVNVVYTVTPVSAAGCPGDAFTVTLTVNPEPVGADLALTRCSDETIGTLLSTSPASVAATTYNIAVSSNGLVQSGGTPSAGNGKLADELLGDAWVNTGLLPVNVVYTVTPVSGSGCRGNDFTITVTVNPEPVGISTTFTRCSDDAAGVNLTTDATSVAAATYEISVNSNGLSQSGGTVSNGTGKLFDEIADDRWRNTGTVPVNVVYTIVPVSAAPASCRGNSFTVTITINPEPVANNLIVTACSDVALGTNLSTVPTSVSASSYIITTNANGLVQSGGTVSAGSGRSASEIADDRWTNIGAAPVNVVYTIIPVSSDNCQGDPFTLTATINPEPVGNPINTSRCSDEVLGITLGTSPTSAPAISYNITTNSNGLTQSGGTVSAGTSKNAGEIADDVWRNTGLVPVDVVYTIVPLTASGCAGDSFTVTVTINPEPVGANVSQSVCSDVAAGILLSTNPASVVASTYTITVNANGLTQVGGTPSSGAGLAANEIADDVWRNTGLTSTNVVYTIIPVAVSGCEGNSFTVTLTVRPEPVGTDINLVRCSDQSVATNLSTSGTAVAAATYTINVNANGLLLSAGTASAGSGKSATEIADDVWRNTGTSPVDVVYTVTPVSAGAPGCEGDPFTITVTVNPEPVVAPITASNICSDDPSGVLLGAGTSVAAASFNISVNSNGLVQSGGTNSAGTGKLANELADDRWTNTGSVPVNVVYTITPVSASPSSCEGDPFTVTVEILPEPVVASTSSVQCSDVALGITLSPGTSVAAATYNISVNSNGLVQSAGTNSAGTGKTASELADDAWRNTGLLPVNIIYDITPVSASGCAGTPFTVTVLINPEPVGVAVAASTCSDVNAGVTIETLATAVPGATYDITVNPNGLTQSAGSNSAGTGKLANEIFNDQWRNETTSPVNVVYTLIPISSAPSSCRGDAFTITLTVDPEPRGFNDVASICSDETVNYDLLANISNVGGGGNNLVTGTTFSWVAANNTNVSGESLLPQSGSTITDVLNNVTNVNQVVVYTVTPVTNGCTGSSFTVSVTVRPEPRGFNDNSKTICSGDNTNYDLAANIANTTLGGNNLTTGTTYTWVAANNASVGGESLAPVSSATISDILTNVTGSVQTVVYTVTPTNGTCVGNPFTVQISVSPQPVGQLDNSLSACSGSNFSYNIQTANIDLNNSIPSRFTFTVSSSNEAAVPTPVALDRTTASSTPITGNFINTSGADVIITYTITPFSTIGNCQGDPFDVLVTIHPSPTANAVNNVTVCSGSALNENLQALITNGVASQFRYTVSSSNPIAVFPGANRTVASASPITDTYTNTSGADVTITYTVTPISGNSCEGTPFEVRVRVQSEPVGSDLTNPVCSSGIPLNHNMQTQITNGVSSIFYYTVSSSNPGVPPGPNRAIGSASAAAITDTYVNGTGLPAVITYTITAISSANGCAAQTTFRYVVNVDSKPVASAPSITKGAVCSDEVFVFNPQDDINTAPGNSVVSTFVWNLVYDGNPISTGTAGQVTGRFVNTSNVIRNAVFTVTPTSLTGCVGDPFDIVVPILPEPVMNPALTTPVVVCSSNSTGTDVTGIIFSTNGLSVAASTFDVEFDAVKSQVAGLTGTPTTGTGLAANAIENDSYRNTTAAQLRVVYRVTPISAAGCKGEPIEITVLINPEPVLASPVIAPVCSSNSGNVNPINVVLGTNGSSVNASSYTVVDVLYSTGGAFSNALPAGFSRTPVPGTGVDLIKNDRYNNVSNIPVTVRYVVQGVSAAGCLSETANFDVVINPEPIMVPGLAALCSDVASSIIVGPAVGSATITDYELKRIVRASTALVAGPTNAGIGLYPANLPGGQSNFLANDRFTNVTDAPLNVTYTIAPVSSGCKGADQDIVFTVNPAPAVDDNLNRTVCTNSDGGIVLATETSPLSASAVSYNITNVVLQAGLTQTAGNTGVRNGVSTTEIQGDRFNNPTNDPLTVTYFIQPVSATACLGPVRQVVLTVEPTITAAPVNNLTAICSGAGTNIDLLSPTNVTAGNITFNLSVSSSNGGLTTGFIPALNNLPEGIKITDNLINNDNTPSTVSYSITPVANGANAGNGCSGAPVVVTVTVDPKPKVVATPQVQTVCEGSATNISLTTPTVPSSGTMEFLLSNVVASGGVTGTTAIGTVFTPGSVIADVLTNPTNSTQNVVYTLVPRVSGGLLCAGDPINVSITVNPSPSITASTQAPICSGEFVNITLTPDVLNTIATWTVSAPAGVTGAANGSGNLIFQTLFNSGPAPATVSYTITPRVNGCNGAPIVVDVVVNPKPSITGLPTTVNVCNGGLLNVTMGSPVAGTTFTWTVDDPSGLGVPLTGSGNTINQVLTNTLGIQASLTYTVTPTANGCTGDQRLMIVTVAPQLNAQFVSADSYICRGSTEFLLVQLDGQAPFTLVYNDGTSDITLNNLGNFKVITVSPTATTTYTLRSVRDAFNCPVTLNQSRTVNVGETVANFSIVGPTAACSPFNAQFAYDRVAGTRYTWQWFDGKPNDVVDAAANAPGSTIAHQFENPNPAGPITYRVVLRTELIDPNFASAAGCFKTQTQNITVNPTIVLNTFAVPDTVICSGESVEFKNASLGVSSHNWSYVNLANPGAVIETQTSADAKFTFVNNTTENPATYQVTYRADNGFCPQTKTTLVTVYRGFTAGFTEVVPTYAGGQAIVTFNNTSTPLDPTAFRFDWSFGSNATPSTISTSNTPLLVTYTTPGLKAVRLVVTNIQAEADGRNCSRVVDKTINILVPPLVAGFRATPLASCFPTVVEVVDNISTGDTFEWQLIDDGGSIVATTQLSNPTFRIVNPGKYSIFLKNSSSFTGQTAFFQVDNIEVFDLPVASFEARPTTLFVPDTEMTIFNFTVGANNYEWDFDDGTISNEFEPKHIYKLEGIYELMLVASFDHGPKDVDGDGVLDDNVVCYDTARRQIIAKEGGITKIPNAFTPSPNGPSGGGPGSGTFNDVFLPITRGVAEFNMQIYDRWGNLVFESNDKNVGWDGYDRNRNLLPAGVYVYKLTLRLSDGQRTTQVGDVTLIR